MSASKSIRRMPLRVSPNKLSLELNRLRVENARLRSALRIDDLTGLYNARFLRERLDEVLAQRLAEGAAPAILFLDVDFFKTVNEAHGHEAAGRVLGQIGLRIRDLIRRDDVAFRYAGDEFVVLVSGGAAGAALVGERLRSGIAEQAFCVEGHRGPVEVMVTVSVGTKVMQPGERATDILAEADRAMFEAKRRSRNAVVAA